MKLLRKFKLKRKATVPSILAVYSQLSIHEKIAFKAWWGWFGPKGYSLLQIILFKGTESFTPSIALLKNQSILWKPYKTSHYLCQP